jgi:MFS family permease
MLATASWGMSKRLQKSTSMGELGMAREQQQMTSPAFAKKQIFLALSPAFLGYFVYSYFMSTLNNAAPKIAAELNGMALYSWSVSIPSLGLAIGTILAGKLSDIYGRRAIMLGAIGIMLLGALLSAISPTFITLIAARTLLCLGQGAIAPICYAVIADVFAGAERSKWIGLLNFSYGVPALFGPTLSGWLVEGPGWRQIFWWAIPLGLLLMLAAYLMPALIQGAAHKIDVLGAVLITIASSTLIFGFSFAGTTYAWGSVQVLGLLAASLIFWALFLRAEKKTREPFFDTELATHRVFMTASAAGFLSFFGMMAVQLYYPLFMQGVQGMSALKSGWVVTPLSCVMAFAGIPVGFLIARTKRYKWLFVTGYAAATVVLCGMMFFGKDTPALLGAVLATLCGLAMGAMPTVNTIVIQAAVPRRLLGVATSALLFSVTMGMAISPALLGSAMNIKYNSTLKATLPAALTQSANEATMKSLGDPKVLLSEPAMAALRETLEKTGGNGQKLFEQTVYSIRTSMEAGLRTVFVVSAIAMLLAFLLVVTIPEISIEAPVEDKKNSQVDMVRGG